MCSHDYVLRIPCFPVIKDFFEAAMQAPRPFGGAAASRVRARGLADARPLLRSTLRGRAGHLRRMREGA